MIAQRYRLVSGSGSSFAMAELRPRRAQPWRSKHRQERTEPILESLTGLVAASASAQGAQRINQL
jgi:hypothetical protein